MWKSIVFFFFICLSVINGQSVNLSSFNAIKVSGNVSVDLIKSNIYKAEYEIIKGSPEELIIEVENDELVVKIKSLTKGWNRPSTKAKVTVYYTDLAKIDCSAGSSVSSKDDITAMKIEVETSSGAQCFVKIKSKESKSHASSGSKIVISGSSDVSHLDASSGARIDASSLATHDSDVEASSGASVVVNASQSLEADASSGGSVKYKGNPAKTKLNSSISGGSIKSF